MKPLAWLALLLTEADNRTPSAFRVVAMGLSVYLSILAGWQVLQMGQPLDFASFTGGLAALWAGAGIGERVAHYPTAATEGETR